MTRAELINTIIEAVGKDGIDRIELDKIKIERPQYHRADGTYGPIDFKSPPTLMDKVKKLIKRK